MNKLSVLFNGSFLCTEIEKTKMLTLFLLLKTVIIIAYTKTLFFAFLNRNKNDNKPEIL